MKFLTGSLFGYLAGGAAVLLAIALSVVWISLSAQNAALQKDNDAKAVRIEALAKESGGLQVSISNQNLKIEEFRKAADDFKKLAQDAVAAAQAAGANGRATIAALMARPLPTGPAASCPGVDDLIGEVVR